VPSTSIRLVFSNQRVDPSRISDVLGMQPSQREVSSGGFPFWELRSDEANDVESLLPLWISLLEKFHLQLRALSTEDLGGYLDVRVYEDFFVDDELLSRLGATGVGISVWFNPPDGTDWIEPEHSSTLTIDSSHFYSQLDENHFFAWLREIDGVLEVRGHQDSFMVYLSAPTLSESGLRDLIGLLFRYDVPMSFLRSQLTPENEHWFKDPEKYWYQKIFVES